MTNLKRMFAVGATMAAAVAATGSFAQDDLDALLKDLESESAAKPAAPAAVVAKPAEEAAPAAEAKAVEAAPVAEEKAEEKSEESAPEAESVPKVEEKTAEKKAEKPAADAVTDAELLANLEKTEQVRRQALDEQASREINEARSAMKNGECMEAVRHYGLAQKLLNDRASSKNLVKECEQGIAEGLFRTAKQDYALGLRDKAIEGMRKALDMRHPKARRMLERWLAEGSQEIAKTDLSDIKHRRNDADFKQEREQIRKHLRRSRQYLAVRDMENALEECEVVLKNDPYNQEAITIRGQIQAKRKVTLASERVAARDGMIADVDEKWRPVYAVNAAQLNASASETVKTAVGDDPERTAEQEIEQRMKDMRLPTISFKPPATIIEAVDFFRTASVDYDRPDRPVEKRGFNFVLKTPQGALRQQAPEAAEGDDFTSNDAEDTASTGNGLSPIPTITASDITFYEALKLVCDSVDYKFIIRGPVVMVMHKDMSTAEILPRKYNVPESFMERVSTASDEMKQMGGFGNSGTKKASANEGEESPDRDWKAFFEEMGVKWPEGSSIKHIKSLGKLYVRNTRENLAEFEKVLEELGGQPQLIEIETRFVEVSQEDLNSLGFEWILNSDYNIGIDDKVARAIGLNEGGFNSSTSGSGSSQTTTYTRNADGTIASKTVTTTATDGTTKSTWAAGGDSRNIGVNAFGGTSEYSNGNRYLSTVGNHISGESGSTNDQFMRVNAFLGSADLSMILHMLSQRSDTDLLSAPKVVTKSGENAVIKVVTEYIYPQDYDVQLQSSGSSSGSSSSSSQSAILAVVEPQNFTMREVGVILDVTPTYSEANGGTIDLELKPQVVDEPTWKNYGMKIPFTGNASSGTLPDIGNIFTGMSTALTTIGATLSESDKQNLAKSVTDAATDAVGNLSTSSSDNLTYYDAPMEQPFFHVRSIDSKVSITPGSTVVMGGLITEARKAMDDKVPFLGDLPFIGRLFRSHAEQTIKRNLLIFVTGRLITPSGREIRMNGEQNDDASVKPAPKGE